MGRYDWKAINCYFFPLWKNKKKPLEDEKRSFWYKWRKGRTSVLEPRPLQLPSYPAKVLERGLERVKVHLLRSCEAGGLGVIMSPSGFAGTLRNKVSGPSKVTLCCVKHAHLGGRWVGSHVLCHLKYGRVYEGLLSIQDPVCQAEAGNLALSAESSGQVTVFVTFSKPCIRTNSIFNCLLFPRAPPPGFIPVKEDPSPGSTPDELLLALKRSLLELSSHSPSQGPQTFSGGIGSNNDKHVAIGVKNQCLLQSHWANYPKQPSLAFLICIEDGCKGLISWNDRKEESE